MTQLTGPDRDAEQACRLLREYSFDLGGYRPEELILLWQDRLAAESTWIRSAVVEALYQGRYKAFSVEQILRLWKRRGHPVRHFNHEFERVVSGPIDPTASKYAPMTTLSPSELLVPQAQAIASQPAQEPETLATPEPFTPSQASPQVPVREPVSEPTHVPAQKAETVVSPQLSLYQASDWVPSSNPVALTVVATPSPSFHHPRPIRKFTPQPEPSEFYVRLQSVARHSV